MSPQPGDIVSSARRVATCLATCCAVWLATFVAAGAVHVADAVAVEGSPGQRGIEQDEEPISPAALGTYHAFIIGIDEYKEWPDLRFAEKDAAEIKDILISKYGFEKKNVVHLHGAEASKSGIENGLRNLLGQLGENDNLLIYYAGHGQLDPLADSGYWIPSDGRLTDQSSWIRFSALKQDLSADKVKARHIVLVTDSCYGGAIRGVPVLDPGDQEVKVLIREASKKSRQVIASGGLAPVPDSSDFSKLLKQALRENTRPILDLEYVFWSKIYVPLKKLSLGDQDPLMAPIKSGAEFDGKFVLFHAGAHQQQPDRPSEPIPPRQPEQRQVRILSFDASPQRIQPGKETTLTWEVDGADSVKITGFDTVGLSGTRLVKPSETTTYFLTATNRDGVSVTSKLTVFVDSPSAAITKFEASPAKITRRGNATLRWETENAQDVQISDVGPVPASGSKEVRPQETTSYTLEARSGSGESVKRTVQVLVESPPEPVIVSFEADPTGIREGDRASLRWKVENAVRVEITGIGLVPSDGWQSISPSSTTRYMLTAFNEENRRVSSIIIVRVAPATISVTRGRLSFPGDGVKNANNPIGPFCCTGETATIMTNRGYAAGYIYFFDFPGGGRTVGPRSVARFLAVGVSGLSRLADPNSQQIVQWIRFTADELRRGQSKDAQAGGLRYRVSIVDANITNLGGTAYYHMDSVKIFVGVRAE